VRIVVCKKWSIFWQERWIRFRGFIETAESASAFSLRPRALIHGLKPFCIWLRNRREIRDNWLKLSAWAVSMRPLNPLPRSHWHRWIHFCGLIEAAESAFVVSLRPPNPLLQFHWDRGNQTFLEVVLWLKLLFFVKILYTVRKAKRETGPQHKGAGKFRHPYR
jgi:hypothetical protein